MDNILPQLNSNPQLLRNQTLFSSQIDNDLVMLDEAAGLYFGINAVGHEIWKFLETSMTYRALLKILVESYDVTLEQCENDINRFLGQMLQYKLITIVEPYG